MLTNNNTQIGATIVRDTHIPPEMMNLLRASGIQIPDSIKEIAAEVTTSDEARRIIIPKSMTKLQAAKELELQHYNEEQIVDMRADFEGWNYKDALVAIKRVTENVFGWIHGRPTWWTTPTEIDIVVDVKNGKHVIEKAFYNGFKVGPWNNADATVSIDKSGQVIIVIKAKKKFSDE